MEFLESHTGLWFEPLVIILIIAFAAAIVIFAVLLHKIVKREKALDELLESKGKGENSTTSQTEDTASSEEK